MTVSGMRIGLPTQGMIQDFFRSHGFGEHEIVAFEQKGKIKISAYAHSLRKMEEAERAFMSLGLKGCRFKSSVLRPEDWLDKWKRYFRRASLGRTLQVIPLWEKPAPTQIKGKRSAIFLDPGCAFGSGSHETTRLMVSLMEGVRGRFRTFFDIGAGTGILSVVASRLGAEEIWGIDCDGPSVKTARSNFALNRNSRVVARFFKSEIAKFSKRRRFDLVGANLLSATLLQEKRRIMSFVNRGGYLAVSGISRKNLKEFRAGFRDESFRCFKVLQGRNWGALLLQRRS